MPELDEDLRQSAKAAAAAAAVGAAVGIARAIAARAEAAAHPGDDAPAAEEPPADEAGPASVGQDELEQDEPERDEREAVSGTAVERLRGLTEQARSILEELSGADVEVVSAIDRTRDGWRVALEAVEVRRIPDSTDVLATYELELDGNGDLVRYERVRRYARAQSDHGDER